MITLVYGGSASGKSEYAESLLKDRTGTKYYVATMEPFGEEGARRIARHRELRKGKGFETVERYTALKELRLKDTNGAVLLECLGNLAANELFSPQGAGAEKAADEILLGVKALARQCKELVIVGNDIFSDGIVYDEETERYRAILAKATAETAKLADRVVEVVVGIPIVHK